MDYNEWLSCPPYDWPQAEKEARYLPHFKDLTEHHRKRVPYGHTLDLLGYKPGQAQALSDIPMLPISQFKLRALRALPMRMCSRHWSFTGHDRPGRFLDFFDANTARQQQLTLYTIGKDFLGGARSPMLLIDSPSIFKDRQRFTARGAAILGSFHVRQAPVLRLER